MLYLGGALDGVRILGRKTIAYMASDHLEPAVPIGTQSLLPPGHGFGLGFARAAGDRHGADAGNAGRIFLGRPCRHRLLDRAAGGVVAIMMIQALGQREYYRQLFRNLVHAALA